MEVLLGIDGGGTKTELVATARWGGAVARARVGATSLSRKGAEAVGAELERGCGEVLRALGAGAEECAAVCAGFASAGRNQAQYDAMLAKLLPRARVRVMTDAELALWAAVGEGDGIVVIAGTGSIAWGRYEGRVARAGGTEPGNDPGSGDWIRRELASGQASPEIIYERAGTALAELLLACARELRWSAPAAFYTGGVLTHEPLVRAALAAAWPHALAALPYPPAEAALELARRELAR
ncbi:MAG: hypothetical protein EPN33_13910 [Acidobacteria bacterium]|nr:MAG: hypothetical protein EPN33_13910 [Acidobacteriota bacterium]